MHNKTNVLERYVNFVDSSFGENVYFVENTKKKTYLEVFMAVFLFRSLSLFFLVPKRVVFLQKKHSKQKTLMLNKYFGKKIRVIVEV